MKKYITVAILAQDFKSSLHHTNEAKAKAMDEVMGVGQVVDVNADALEQIDSLNEKLRVATANAQENYGELLKAHDLIGKLNEELVEIKDELTKARATIAKRNSTIA